MDEQFINLSPENLSEQHLCCIIRSARKQGKSGVCMLGAQKQKAWLSDQEFAKKFGFVPVDTTADGYELLALSFDGTEPYFLPNAKLQTIEEQELTIYFSRQCPYTEQALKTVRQHCEQNAVPFHLIEVDTLEKAKTLPCVFNNWAVFYKGQFQTVNLLDLAALKRILKK